MGGFNKRFKRKWHSNRIRQYGILIHKFSGKGFTVPTENTRTISRLWYSHHVFEDIFMHDLVHGIDRSTKKWWRKQEEMIREKFGLADTLESSVL
tara:strand:- start:95961 stop:96245 length:285 start_codon:yes stop_codon:yes gene_type:complete